MKSRRSLAFIFIIMALTGISLTTCQYFKYRISPTNEFSKVKDNTNQITAPSTVEPRTNVQFSDSELVIGSLAIPKIDITLDIYNGKGSGLSDSNGSDIDYKSMKKGVVYVRDKNIIFGHNMHEGNKLFTNLPKLVTGDKVFVSGVNNSSNIFKLGYAVKNTLTISSKDVITCRHYQDFPRHLCLITCVEGKDSRCLVLLEKI